MGEVAEVRNSLRTDCRCPRRFKWAGVVPVKQLERARQNSFMLYHVYMYCRNKKKIQWNLLHMFNWSQASEGPKKMYSTSVYAPKPRPYPLRMENKTQAHVEHEESSQLGGSSN